MLNFAVVTLAFTISPPIQPPIARSTKYSGDDWKIVNVDLQTASELLTDFSKSFEDTGSEPDFTCNPILRTRLPQGILGLSYKKKIHVLMHYIEKSVGIASIMLIATPYDSNSDISKILFQKMNASEVIMFDEKEVQKNQPKWYFAYKYYCTDW